MQSDYFSPHYQSINSALYRRIRFHPIWLYQDNCLTSGTHNFGSYWCKTTIKENHMYNSINLHDSNESQAHTLRLSRSSSNSFASLGKKTRDGPPSNITRTKPS